jgi:signal transduction histidine kinase
VAKLHGGTIEAESEPDKGTTMRIVLPLSGTRQF